MLIERFLQQTEFFGAADCSPTIVHPQLGVNVLGMGTYGVQRNRALTLAEPEGYVRIFLDEGKPMAELLKRAGKNKSSFLEKQAISPQPLIEPLSENELEVLRLLRTDLSGPEIARECMVSLNTVRTHTQNIYAKLGVNNRRAAVHRAEELDLL